MTLARSIAKETYLSEFRSLKLEDKLARLDDLITEHNRLVSEYNHIQEEWNSLWAYKNLSSNQINGINGILKRCGFPERIRNVEELTRIISNILWKANVHKTHQLP